MKSILLILVDVPEDYDDPIPPLVRICNSLVPRWADELVDLKPKLWACVDDQAEAVIAAFPPEFGEEFSEDEENKSE